MPDARILALALLYSLGAHGILTLNDYKAMEGDRRMGVRSLPVQLGPVRAAWVCAAFFVVPQAIVVALLASWDRPVHALVVAALLGVQAAMLARFVRQPRERALWMSALGVNFYVAGMMVSAFAVRALAGGG
jgi:chlorophyll synthase